MPTTKKMRRKSKARLMGMSVGKTGDPVRMYLREMGTVSLLSREGEVEIAKKIEVGEKKVIEEVLSSPLALRYVLDLGEKLAQHEIRVREIIKDGDEDAEYLEDEEVHEKRLLDQIAKIRRAANEREKIRNQLEGKRVSAQRRQALQQSFRQVSRKNCRRSEESSAESKTNRSDCRWSQESHGSNASARAPGEGIRAQNRQIASELLKLVAKPEWT